MFCFHYYLNVKEKDKFLEDLLNNTTGEHSAVGGNFHGKGWGQGAASMARKGGVQLVMIGYKRIFSDSPRSTKGTKVLVLINDHWPYFKSTWVRARSRLSTRFPIDYLAGFELAPSLT